MTVQTLTAYFKNELIELGYDDIAQKDDIKWSLGYCQGDGVELPNASIHEDDAKTLCNRLLSGKYRAAAKRALDKGLELEAGGRYGAEANDYNCEPELTALENEAVDKLTAAIDADIKAIEARFAEDGYAFIEATPTEDEPEVLLKKELPRFTLTISKTHADWVVGLYDDDHEECLAYSKSQMKDIISGKTKYFDLKISIEEREYEFESKEVAYGYIGTCYVNGDEDPLEVNRDYFRERLTEVINEARTTLDMERPEREAVFAQRRIDQHQAFLAEREAAEQRKREAELEAVRQEELAEQERVNSLWGSLSLGNNFSQSAMTMAQI